MPRHPPDALKALDHSHYQCPPAPRPVRDDDPLSRGSGGTIRKDTSFTRSVRKRPLYPLSAGNGAGGETIGHATGMSENPALRASADTATDPRAHARNDPCSALAGEQTFSSRCHLQQEGTKPSNGGAGRHHTRHGGGNSALLERSVPIIHPEREGEGRAVVEPVGIEPTTPCLQSRCSPS